MEFAEKFASLVSGGITIFSSLFDAITGNWFLMGSIAIPLVIGLLFGVYHNLHK